MAFLVASFWTLSSTCTCDTHVSVRRVTICRKPFSRPTRILAGIQSTLFQQFGISFVLLRTFRLKNGDSFMAAKSLMMVLMRKSNALLRESNIRCIPHFCVCIFFWFLPGFVVKYCGFQSTTSQTANVLSFLTGPLWNADCFESVLPGCYSDLRLKGTLLVIPGRYASHVRWDQSMGSNRSLNFVWCEFTSHEPDDEWTLLTLETDFRKKTVNNVFCWIFLDIKN